MTKVDPYKHKERYIKWKEEAKNGISEISKYDSDLILRYLDDMEMGINVAGSTKKGARSYVRLNSLKIRLISISKRFREKYNLEKITDVNESQVHKVFTGMRNGAILKQNNKPYKSTGDFVKIFKAFWHWWMKINKKQSIRLMNIIITQAETQEKQKNIFVLDIKLEKIREFLLIILI